MVDVNPEVFNNPELGQANHLQFLDEVEAQMRENQQAKAEGRTPRKVKPKIRFGPNANIDKPFEFEEGTPEFDETYEGDLFQRETTETVEDQKEEEASSSVAESSNNE